MKKVFLQKEQNKLPITKFPVDKKQQDKTGINCCMGKTNKEAQSLEHTTLLLIQYQKVKQQRQIHYVVYYVYKNATEVTRTTAVRRCRTIL